MLRLRVDWDGCPEELRAGLGEIRAERGDRFSVAPDALTVRFVKQDSPGLEAAPGEGGMTVRYGRLCDAFRALGRLLGAESPEDAEFRETPRFDMLGLMVDVSRNGVLLPEAAKALMRRCALMGLNMVMLYAEDTYEVPGEPFFGYLRGRYTQDEMRDLDDCADALGIEMIPCIQTLAHLEQILQWPAYGDYRDVHGVILAEEERTYELVGKLIAAASEPFRSRRIHLGMDEAHGIGTGRYRQRHGEKSSFEILNAHLARVRDICRERGLEPMIWSDMYFRIGSKTDSYYDLDAVVPPEVVERIPKDVQLVYWDYYHGDAEFYSRMIERHRALGSEPVMAGGGWTWNHLWAALPFAFMVTDACMSACREQGLREVFLTLWGDDGMECDLFSALPALQFFAEHGYGDGVDEGLLRANFRGSCDAEFDDWVRAADVDSVPCLASPTESNANPGKWLLWQDPLLALMDPQVEGVDLRSHYEALARELEEAAEKPGAAARLEFPAQLARVLALKCNLRRDLAGAYAAGERGRLESLLDGDLAELQREAEALWKCHRDMWLATYKPFGLEVIESRYGGLLARLESLSDRLRGYLDGEVASIPELEVKLERVYETAPGTLPGTSYSRVATPSTIK